MEVANALSQYDRKKVITFIQQCYANDNILVVNITPQLFQKGLTLYGSRQDQTWGLVDWISFIVMKEKKLTDAVTSDIHFIQAGFQALLR